MANKYGSDNIEYGKSFQNDSKFKDILDNTSIDSKVTINQVHKNINSLAGVLEKSQLDAHKQFKSLSSSIYSTAKEQQKMAKKFKMKELSSDKQIKMVEKSTQQILGKLGYTIDVLGNSSKQILINTADATKRTLKEYGNAISSDFSVNKGNLLAMSLAKASPIFGYFAGKFMETSVFKNFATMIKEKLGEAVTFVGNKIKDLWIRGRERTTDWWNKRKKAREISKQSKKEKGSLKNQTSEVNNLPKLASGGLVKKEGVAYIHAAEVVTPIAKLRKEFISALIPTKNAIVKELRGLRYALVGVGRDFSASFSVMLNKNPFFVGLRSVFSMMKSAYNVVKFFFGRRNKYSAMLSRNSNPMARIADNMGLLFTQSMFRLDIIISHLAQLVLAKTGKMPDAPKVESWTRYKKIKNFIADVKKHGLIKTIKKSITGQKDIDWKQLSNFIDDIKNKNPKQLIDDTKKITTKSIDDIKKTDVKTLINNTVNNAVATTTSILQKNNIEPKKIKQKLKDVDIKSIIPSVKNSTKTGLDSFKKSFIEETKNSHGYKLLTNPKQILENSKNKFENKFEKTKSNINDLREKFFSKNKFEKTKSNINDLREKFFSKNKFENKFEKTKSEIDELQKKVSKKALSYYKKAEGAFKEERSSRKIQEKYLKKIRSATEGTENKLGLAHTSLRKALSSLGTFLLLGFGVVKSAIGKVIKVISKIVWFLMKMPFKALAMAVRGLVKFSGFLIKRFPAIAGALSALDMAKDAVSGATKAREWHNVKEGKNVSTSQYVTSSIGGALGGTKSGAEGAKEGALKGAGMGMMIGSAIAPGIGTAIGGAFGAIAGGLLGAVGGKNIAIGLQSTWDSVEGIVSGAWKLIKLPFRMIKALGKRAKNYLYEKYEKIKETTDNIVYSLFEPIFKVFDKIQKSIDGSLDPIFDLINPIVNFISDSVKWVITSIKKITEFILHPFDKLKDFFNKVGDKSTTEIQTNKETEIQKNKYRKSTINSFISSAMDWAEGKDDIPKPIRKFESGGIVPKAVRGGLDGRGGQLAIVHEGEKIIPKSVVESSKLSGNVPDELKEGNATPDLISIISNVVESIKEVGSTISGGFKAGFEKVKAALGPSSGFGWLSRMFESAGAGPGAIGWDSTGGWSYGSYQLAEKRGTVQRFMREFPEIAKNFNGLNVGSPQFNDKWKSLATKDPSFAQAQHEFIKKQYLYPYMDKIKNMTGIDLSLKNPVISEEVLSTAVQYGPGSNVIPNALKGLNQNTPDDVILKKIGEYKYNNVSSNFRSSSPAIQRSVSNRIQREISLALGSLGTGQGVAPGQLPKAAEGGVITKEGPIYAHAGEVIGPINDVKESLLRTMMSKKDIARTQTNGQISEANILAGIKGGNENLDSGKQMVIMMNNFTNNMASSLNNLSNAIMNGNKNNSAIGGNNIINNILTGDIS